MDRVFMTDFRTTVDASAERLLTLTDAEAAARPVPGKWSPKEIIGHLIDSASNNHGRFIRAQLQKDLVFDGYEQDDWVRVQCYRDRAWPDLVRLWQGLNQHIAHVMETAAAEALAKPRPRHNLDAIAFRPVDRGQPATLDYFMRDYFDHLKHHLRQVPTSRHV